MHIQSHRVALPVSSLDSVRCIQKNAHNPFRNRIEDFRPGSTGPIQLDRLLPINR